MVTQFLQHLRGLLCNFFALLAFCLTTQLWNVYSVSDEDIISFFFPGQLLHNALCLLYFFLKVLSCSVVFLTSIKFLHVSFHALTAVTTSIDHHPIECLVTFSFLSLSLLHFILAFQRLQTFAIQLFLVSVPASFSSSLPIGKNFLFPGIPVVTPPSLAYLQSSTCTCFPSLLLIFCFWLTILATSFLLTSPLISAYTFI